MRSLPLLATLLAAFPAATGAARQHADVIVAGGRVVTLDPARRVLDDGAVAIRGERIVAVGPTAEVRAAYRARREVSARGAIVLPGLINAHSHAPMVLLRGLADDRALMEWLQKFIFPAEARNVTPEFVRWGTALACAEMIRGGTTTFCDMYYFEDVVAEVAAAAGMRAVLGETILDFPTPDSKSVAEGLAYADRFIRRWRGHPRITPAVAPHAAYTNSADSLRAARALADRHGVPLVVHLAETRDEERAVLAQHGVSPTAWLERLGILAPRVIANHAVHVSDADMAILKSRGVGVTHNPESNMKLASGVAPIPRLLALGIAVGLGTDGAASNNDLSMFEAMDFTAKLHKLATGDPRTLPAETVVELATLGGARALGLQAEIGSLVPGKRADLVVVDATLPHTLPLYNVYSQLVYALKASDVRSSIIDGKVVMLERRLLTLADREIMERARALAERVRASLTR